MQTVTNEILREVNRVILGKQDQVRKVLLAILAGGHVLLEDVPGVGKTTMAMAFARVLGLTTRRVQFTSDTMPSDIVGFSVYDKDSGSLKYQPGAVMTNLLLADEINRTSAKTQSALLEAIEERRVTVDGVTRALPMPFVVLATQNPVGSAGTQRLPESQLDRFLIRISLGYPDVNSQAMLMKERHHDDPMDACRAVTDAQGLVELCAEAMRTHMSDNMYMYIALLAQETRNDPDVQLGLSPRGALALARAARANACLEGRDYAVPDDVLAVFPDVTAHRLVLSARARLHEVTAQQLAAEIASRVKKPDVKEFRLG